jgi:hypothetical protein
LLDSPSGTSIRMVRPDPFQGDQGLEVASGVADSPDRKEYSTLELPGASPSHRKAPKWLVRPVSLTGETYSPGVDPARRR